jgi:hypothetical protein
VPRPDPFRPREISGRALAILDEIDHEDEVDEDVRMMSIEQRRMEDEDMGERVGGVRGETNRERKDRERRQREAESFRDDGAVGGLRYYRGGHQVAAPTRHEVRHIVEGGCKCARGCFLVMGEGLSVAMRLVTFYRVKFGGLVGGVKKQWLFYRLLELFKKKYDERCRNLKQGFFLNGQGLRVDLTGYSARRRYQHAQIEIDYELEDPTDPLIVHPMCREAYMKATGASSDMITQMLALIKTGRREFYGELLAAAKERNDPYAQTVIMFGEKYALDQGENDPTKDGVVHIPEASIKNLYPEYVANIEDGLGVELGVTRPASLPYFVEVFRRNFDEIIKPTKRLHKFSKCSYCATCKFEASQYPKSSEVGKTIDQHYRRHLRWVACNRQKYRHHRAKAKWHPDL